MDPWLFQTWQVGQSTTLLSIHGIPLKWPWIHGFEKRDFPVMFFNTPEGKNPIVVKHLHSSAGYILFILAVSQNLVYQNCHCHTESCDEAMDVQGFPIIVFALHFPWGFPLNNPWVFPSFPRVFHHISVVRTV